MKSHKKTITVLLTAAALLITAFVTGCTRLSEVPNNPTSEADVPAESDGSGVYVKLEREDMVPDETYANIVNGSVHQSSGMEAIGL